MTKRVRNEISIHRTLSHPNILRLHHHFDDYKAVYLVMELCEGGELYQVLKRQGGRGVEEEKAKLYFRDILNGLDYLHNTKRIIHRDLKLSNILLYLDGDRQTVAKIGDFGLACYMDGQRDGQDDHCLNMTICGTPNYLAPEVVQKRPYGQEADLWSLGCLLFAMLVGRAPFEGHSLRATFDKVVSGVFQVPDSLSPSARNLICALMRTDPHSRIKLRDIMVHPFVGGEPLFTLPNFLKQPDTNLINTKTLKPIKQSIKHGCIEIDTLGRVQFTVDSDRSVMTVSPDGQRVSFTDAHGRTESCTVGELGRAARKRYDYMKRFVDLVRTKTPIASLRHDQFKTNVFNSDGLFCLVQFNSNTVNMEYQERTDSIVVNNTDSLFHPTYTAIHKYEGEASIRKGLLEFVNRLAQLKKALCSLPSDYSKYPLVIDETTQTLKSPPSYITLKSMDHSDWTNLSGLRPKLKPLFCRSVGWKVPVDTTTDYYLLMDGKCVRHDKGRGVCSEDEGTSWHNESRYSSILRSFEHYSLYNKP